MSRCFVSVGRNGYVVRDVHSVMRYWTSVLGVGVFYFIWNLPVEEVRNRGVASDVRIGAALANAGDLQIELIEQTNGSPSMCRGFLGAFDEGLQHIANWSLKFEDDLQRTPV